MSVYIHQLETVVPEMSYGQEFASELMQRNVGDDERTRRIIKSIYSRSGIRKRHSVIHDFSDGPGDPLFFDKNGDRLSPPDTRFRNDYYTREARPLFSRLAKQLIAHAPDFEINEITHVITVSCTGFFAPGPDFHVVRDLDLPGSTQRYHIGFMGCYAAFQGLKMAQAFCRSAPDAVVLVLCVELCTLHLQFHDNPDAIIAASVFADGGSGALVSARKPSGRNFESQLNSESQTSTEPEAISGFQNISESDINPGSQVKTDSRSNSNFQAPIEILSFYSDLTPNGEKDMAWTIGNEGFLMKLSTYVPEIIRSNIGPVLDNILKSADLTRTEIEHWAIHPGGRAILDNICDALQIPEEKISASRSILSDYGNMSSATILFVLKELAESMRRPDGQKGQKSETPQTVFGMAFGPGLTIESGLFNFYGTYSHSRG